jgi:hypothetical protein
MTYHVLLRDWAGAAGPGGGSGGGGSGGGNGDVLCDEFYGNDGDPLNGHNLSCGFGSWNGQVGGWTITNNTARGSVSGFNPGWIVVPYLTTDASEEVTITGVDSMCGGGLALNSGLDQNANTASTLAVTLKAGMSNNLQVVKTVTNLATNAGTPEVLAAQTVTLPGNNINALRVTRIANTLYIWVNDTQLDNVVLDSSVADSFVSNNFGLYTSCSMYNPAIRFDHFKVAPASLG